MSEQQLERSVLESKERDELFTIANALGTSPTTRARKSDLVNLILQATGVEVVSAPPVPERVVRRARPRPSAEEPAAAQLPLAASAEGAATPAPELEAAAVDGRSGDGEPGVGRDGGSPAEPGVEPAAAPTEAANPDAGHDEAATGEGGDDGNGGGRFDEPGNRRSRRRRGRDRSERPERDLAGQAPEQQFSGEPVPVSGLLDLREEGYGFLRTAGLLAGPHDVYVSISQVRRLALRRGDHVEGASRPAGGNEKYPALVRADTVSGLPPEEARQRRHFDDLTPLYPDTRLRLGLPGDPGNVTVRLVDLLTPIGRGQRGLVLSPPKTGKSTVLKQLARSIELDNPDVHLIVLLVDERPEDVTELRRSVKAEVVASGADRPAEEHIQVAELALERAKRMVELGRDVVILLDGITRLARAYNLAMPASGRSLAGGIDAGALYPTKKLFTSARRVEEGGSLTIVATALSDSGSRIDELILEEVAGSATMELRLERRLAQRRVHPAVDVAASSSAHEDLLVDREQLDQVRELRRALAAIAHDGGPEAALEALIARIRATDGNEELLAGLAANPVVPLAE